MASAGRTTRRRIAVVIASAAVVASCSSQPSVDTVEGVSPSPLTAPPVSVSAVTVAPVLTETTVAPTADGHDEYISDPAKPVPYRPRPVTATYPGKEWKEWMVEDQRFTHHRPDVLSYETPPLTEDVVLAGNITAKLFGFQEYPYFEAPKEAQAAPKVSFGAGK